MGVLTTNKEAVAAGFVFNEIYYNNDLGRRLKCMDVTIPATYGGLSNTIAAGCFGMTAITEAVNARVSASSAVFIASPSYDQSKLYFYDLTQGTDANRNLPTDTTATTRITVRGKE